MQWCDKMANHGRWTPAPPVLARMDSPSARQPVVRSQSTVAGWGCQKVNAVRFAKVIILTISCDYVEYRMII